MLIIKKNVLFLLTNKVINKTYIAGNKKTINKNEKVYRKVQ